MRPLLLLATALSLAFAPAPFPPPPRGNADVTKADLRRLQGDWEVIQYRRGKQVRTDVGLRLAFAGSRMTWAYDGDVCSEWRITLDTTASPKAICQVAEPKGARLDLESVYHLRGDQLMLCVPIDSLLGRATSFAPSRGHALYVLRRVRP